MELRYCEKCGDIIPLEGKEEKIKLAEHFVCARCLGGDAPQIADSPEKAASDSFFDSILDETSMNLFSPETVLIRRNEAKATEEAIQEGQPKLAEEGSPEGTAPGKGVGSEAPARTARKLQFHCLHCRVVLLVRPVYRASRMICPKCKGNLFLDRTGIISKSPPSVVKMAKPTAPAASPALAGPGSSEEMAMNPSQNSSVGPRPSKNPPGKLPDKAVVKLPDKAPGKLPDKAVVKLPDKAPVKLPVKLPDKAPGKEGHGADMAENVAKNKIEEARRAFAPSPPIEAKRDLGIGSKPPQGEGAALPVPPPALEPSLRSAPAVRPAGTMPSPPLSRGGTVPSPPLSPRGGTMPSPPQSRGGTVPLPPLSPRGGTEKPALVAIGLKKSATSVIEPTVKEATEKEPPQRGLPPLKAEGGRYLPPLSPPEGGRVEAEKAAGPSPSSTSVDPHKPPAKEASRVGEKKWEPQAPIGLAGRGPIEAASDAWTEWNKKAKGPLRKGLPDQAASGAADLDDSEEPPVENLREAEHFTATPKAPVKSPSRYVETLTLPLVALKRNSAVSVLLRLVLFAAALSAPIWTVGWILPAETTRATAFIKFPSRKKVGEITIRGVQAILEFPEKLFAEPPRKGD